MAAVIPSHQIPYDNIVKILGKMSFKTACRMRQTCHNIDEMVRAKAQKLKFPVENRITFMFCLYENYCCPRWELLYPGHPDVMMRIPDPRRIECAQFDSIKVECAPSKTREIQQFRVDLIEYINTARIKGPKLIIQNGLADEFDVIKMYRECRASSFSMETMYYEDEQIGTERPLSMDIIRQLACESCRELYTSFCDYLPADYADVLSQFEYVRIDSIVEKDPYSLYSIIELWISGNVPLVHFCLPVYCGNIYIESEIFSKLKKWQFKTNHSSGLVFSTSDGYAFLMESQQFCAGYKASWHTVDQFVLHLLSYFVDVRIPIDASGLFDIFTRQDMDIEEYMLSFLNHISSYHFE